MDLDEDEDEGVKRCGRVDGWGGDKKVAVGGKRKV